MKIAETVAAGDLSSRIEVTQRDDTGRPMQALKDMNESLVRVVGDVRHGSEYIASGTADLSPRTEVQAANLQQTAASMEELASTVRQSARLGATGQRPGGAGQLGGRAGRGGVRQGVDTMSGLSASSQRIGDIIGVVDGVVFQTGILALNAAAREIKSLTQESTHQVESGSALVHGAGRNVQDIVKQVGPVSEMISLISCAATEQTQGIGQVNDAVPQLDQVTQQNAALVEDSAVASDGRRTQATKLLDAVRAFRLEAAVQAA